MVRDWIGHGVGRTVHEDPEVPNYGKPGTKLVLKPGMTIAIEPMITMTKGGEKTDVLGNGWTVVPLGALRAHGGDHRRRVRDSDFAGGLSLKLPGPKALRSNGG